jgi:hypothetical protein
VVLSTTMKMSRLWFVCSFFFSFPFLESFTLVSPGDGCSNGAVAK